MARSRLVWGSAMAVFGVVCAVVLPGATHGSNAVAAAMTAHPQSASKVPAGPTPPKGKPEFNATFTGSRLNTKVWSTCYWWAKPTQTPAGCSNYGANDQEWYMPSQVHVAGGYLHLIAQRMSTNGLSVNGTPEVYGCRSGMVTTFNGFKFTYGFVQVVAEIPHDAGLWPALWLEPTNKNPVPEIDMVESWGVKQKSSAYYHPAPFNDKTWPKGPFPVKWSVGWQTYTLVWTKSELVFYVGKNVVLKVTKQLPRMPMYFLADLAGYVSPVVSPDCNGQLLIRSVKVWKV